MRENKKILLIDANALIHRAFHALPPLISPSGELVNAVYGFASALLRALKEEKPQYAVVCYDAGRQTFRNNIYNQYKATRQKTAEELYLQIPRTKEFVESLSIPLYSQKGVEADDLIGSLAKIASKKGLKAVIVTGDKDVLQLIDNQVSVYSMHRGFSETLSYNAQVVKEKIGVWPHQIVDYKALAGDASDNIPGIPGFGPKTAAELLNRFQNIEGIYSHLNELPDRQRRLLTEHKKTLEMSRELARIRTDLKIDLDLKQAEVANFDFSQAVNFFNQMGFRSLVSRLPESNRLTQEQLFSPEKSQLNSSKITLPHQLVDNTDKWEKIFPALCQAKALAIDTETVDLKGELIGISFAWADPAPVNKTNLFSGLNSAYLALKTLPISHGVELGAVKKDLEQLLASNDKLKIGHNLKFDLAVLKRAGLISSGPFFDTLVASSLINADLPSQKLDLLASKEFNYEKIPISQLIGDKKDKLMSEAPLDKLALYSCEDALVTYQLYLKYNLALQAPQLKRVFFDIEMPLLPILMDMERIGIKIDRDHLSRLSQNLRKRKSEIEKEIHRQVGAEFNLASPHQLKEILFNRLKLSRESVRRVKTGLSTDAESLTKLKGAHPVIPLILEHREIAKLLSTYVDALAKLADENDRVHTTFMQIGAITGRLSSQNPNLQNIPIRTPLGMEVRRAFIADKGKVLIGADYSQVELRIVAHLSDDEKMIEAFNRGADIHQTVSELLGIDRRSAKAINFGIIYGLGPNALANDLGISLDEARRFIDNYLKTFPAIVRYMEMMKSQAREQGYVETLFGRRRYLPDIHSPNQPLRAAAERMAVNMPSQGTVADIIKLSMVEARKQLPQKGVDLLLQIHDELLWEVEQKDADQVAKQIPPIMTEVISLKVPLVVEVKIGANWAELEKVN